MEERVKNKELRKKIMSADEAAKMIDRDMVIGCSGFTPSGYPRAVPLALAKKYKNVNSAFKPNLTILTGASVGDEIDTKLVETGLINRRYPYQTNKVMRDKINQGQINYSDIHLSHFPQQVRNKYFGNLDFAIIEAVFITEDGNIIPTTSVGASPTFVSQADKVIIEINLKKPASLKGIHDIYEPDDPPFRKPIPLERTGDRIGTEYIPVEPGKIAAIVLTNYDYNLDFKVFQNDISEKIARYIIKFLEAEAAASRIPADMLPIQSGVGSVANAVLSGLSDCSFRDIEFYSEVIQDSVLDLFDQNKIKVASGTSITLSQNGYQRFLNKISEYKEKIILRPQEISNNPEIIRRLGVIAINTAIEFDIYGNVNSTNINGSFMMNGIGGSGDFARNSYLSFFVTPSLAKGGKISTVVPMVSHVDHTEHDVDILVTENGLADLRGLSPRERSEVIIENCAENRFKDKLHNYFDEAAKDSGGHTPHNLYESFNKIFSTIKKQ